MLIRNYKINLNKSALIFFSILLLFILSRQVPFGSFSFLMNISLGMIIILSFKEVVNKMVKKKDLFFFFIVVVSFLIIEFFYSLFLQNIIGNVIRFFLILFFIAISYFVVLPKKILTVFIYLFVLHALLITLFSLYLTFFFTIDNYLPIRFFFQEMGWGDVFTYNGWFYRIQIKGNALLPVAFFISFFSEISHKKLIRGILLVSCVFAGNIAYLIAIFFFLVVYSLKTQSLNILFKRFLILSIMLLISLVPIYKYFIKDTIELKSDSSLPTRTDQINVLMDDMTEKSFYIAFGRGLGHTIEKVTSFRDYRGDVYFELQSLYILNQIGVLGFTFFFLYNVYISFRLFNVWLIFIYGCYILYAFTNPYIFDTNHVVVILILNSIQNNET
jgi:hypothetical protein